MAELTLARSRLGAILRSTSGNFLEQFDFFLFGFYAGAFPRLSSRPGMRSPDSS
jgi:MFS transporter, MHS family, citrate/tricarballylate:H+ symporter